MSLFTSIQLKPFFALVAGLMLIGATVGCTGSKLNSQRNISNALTQVTVSQELRAGVKFNTPPFGSLTNTGKLAGYDIAIIREIAKRLSDSTETPINVKFQQVLPTTRIVGLNLGKLDLVAATMTITPERETFIDFTDSYFTAKQAVIVPVDSSIYNVKQLFDKRIFYVIGTTSEANVRNAFPQATFRGFKTLEGAIKALENGEGDALTNDDIILYGLMKEHCGFKMLPERISLEPYGLGIRKNSDQVNTRTFRRKINQILTDMKKDGTIATLEAEWIKPLQITKSVCKLSSQS